jgi:oxygen-independent coproporphyrinogen-3 oxidase
VTGPANGPSGEARPAEGMGLYVHVPFCSAKCRYCAFYSIPIAPAEAAEYVHAVTLELRRVAGEVRAAGRRFATLYVGGGTPSVLPLRALEELVEAVLTSFEFEPGAEVTVECNPESFDEACAHLAARSPGGRISLGVQSFSPSVLSALGRRHDPEAAVRAVGLARDAGVRSVSLDLIYGAPGETLRSWRETLERAVELSPEHVSCYCLSAERGTPLGEAVALGALVLPGESLQAEMYREARAALTYAGYEHYEISNFARPGFRSRHNEGYWRRGEYLGLGPAAHSFQGGVRRSNVASVDEYCRRLRAGDSPVAVSEAVSAEEAFEEKVMLALRTSDGLSLGDLDEGCGRVRSLLAAAGPLVAEGVLLRRGCSLSIAPDAYFVSDSVIASLLPPGCARSGAAPHPAP